MRAWLSSLVVLLMLVPGCAGRTLAKYDEEPVISLYVAETGETKHLRLENYIKGVVAAEMDPSWPDEALGAQAILARTFTIERMIRGKTKQGADASTDVSEFQAYDRQRINERVERAVDDTRGEVAVYRERPIRAYFHSCSGGETANAREGLGLRSSPAYLKGGVTDPDCENEDLVSWQASFSLAEVNAALAQIGSRPSDLRSASVAKKGPAGRATTLQLGQRRVNAARFRVALDPEKMKSTLLTGFGVEGGRLVMTGQGWGHGVGMSQWGAKARADDGDTAEEIVSAYFSGVRIRKLYD